MLTQSGVPPSEGFALPTYVCESVWRFSKKEVKHVMFIRISHLFAQLSKGTCCNVSDALAMLRSSILVLQKSLKYRLNSLLIKPNQRSKQRYVSGHPSIEGTERKGGTIIALTP